MTTRAQIVATAKGWLDTPYHHQALLRGVGVDCIGLIVGVAIECHIPEGRDFLRDPACMGYSRQPDPSMLLEAADRYLDRIDSEYIRSGDILVFRFETEPQHFALVTDTAPLRVVHAMANVGYVREHRIDNLWRSRIVRAYSFRGLDG